MYKYRRYDAVIILSSTALTVNLEWITLINNSVLNYKCIMLPCKKTFSIRGSLQWHKYTHDGKHFVYALYFVAFTRKSNLSISVQKIYSE